MLHVMLHVAQMYVLPKAVSGCQVWAPDQVACLMPKPSKRCCRSIAVF